MATEPAAGEGCACQFGVATGTDFPTNSRHLSLLKQAGIVADDKRDKQV
jgi:ArsR family transcriptional regulator